MNKSSLKNVVYGLFFIGLTTVNYSFAQTQPENIKQINFRYSQNPKANTKSTTQKSNNVAGNDDSAINKDVEKSENAGSNTENRTIAAKTFEIAKRANIAALSPTEVYKIGTGDILIISLQNAPNNATNYFTVLSDGTIDYPLAGEMINVSGLTTEEVEDLLKEKIKLYDNPQVVVKVREYASHSFTVLGLVEKAGEKFLQREAMPLYTIRAEAITQPQVTTAIIKRANGETEKIELSDSKSDAVLIFPGDIVEFKSAETENPLAKTPQFYYIGGNINSGGQKDFYQGITLTQAILASGGLKKANVKRVIIRRKNQEGMLSPLEFDLKSIKSGSQIDPILQAGDTIELVD